MRDYQSVSSITTFLGCPNAYNLHYNLGIKGKVNKNVEIGSWVHKQLEKSPDHHEDAQEFVDARDGWLKDNNDEIIEVERRFEIEVPGIGKIVLVLDAITKNDIFLDYKVGEMPKPASNTNFYSLMALLKLPYMPEYIEDPPAPYYTITLPLQARIYTALMALIELHYRPIYLILQYKIMKRKAGDYLQFVRLVEDCPPVTPMMQEYSLNEFKTTIKMIAACEETGVYPASMNGCGRCFYREHCDFYFGF